MTDDPSPEDGSNGTLPADHEIRRLAGPAFTRLEQSGKALLVTDPRLPDNPIVFANAAFTALTGYAPAAVYGRNCRMLQGQETDSDTVSAIRAAVREGRPSDSEILNYRKDGSAFWNGLSITPAHDAAGKLLFLVATLTDITTTRRPGAPGEFPRGGEPHVADENERMRVSRFIAGAAASWEWQIAESRLIGDARFAALYGLRGDEAVLGTAPATFYTIIHPQDQPRIRLAVGAMLRGAEVFSKDYRVLLADGAVRWVHARGRCHYDEDDRPTRFSGTLVDITEQKRVEEQLRIAQTAGGIGTFEYVHGFATASVSEQFCRLLGLHAARDLPTRSINALVVPGDPLIVETGARPSRGVAHQIEFRIVRPDDGETRWLTRRGEFLQDADGVGLRFVGVVYDVTHAKRTEEQLRLLNETLEVRVEERTRERDRIWQVSRDLYVLCGMDGSCRSTNPAWQSELGYAPDELAGRLLTSFIHPDDRAAIDGVIARLRRGEYVENFDARVLAKDGEVRWFGWTCVPEGNAFFGAGRDNTERNQLEEQLRQSQKMEAVGQLTGGIAHDFNNMLTGITGSLDLVRRRIKEGRMESVDRFMEAATTSAHRAAALIHRLLAFSRRQSLDVRELDINRLIVSMEELLRRSLGERISLEFRLEEGLWAGLSDANQLENALLNLAINARDAMPDGGRLRVESSNVSLGADYARQHEDVLPGDYVVICVSDTGVGMSPEVVAKAFEPFFTTKPIGQGTGLGLSMIYGFAKQSNGHVRIDSELGRGTAVRLYIPRFLGTPAARQTDVVRQSLPTAQGETVLVVEDDPGVRLFVTDALQDLGYAVLEAHDSDSALPILRSAAKLDLMLSDVGLPGMTGRQLADIARQHRPGLKIVFMTGYAESATVRATFLTAGMDMISKPFSLDILAIKIRDILRPA